MNTKQISYDTKGEIEKVSIIKGIEQFLDDYEYYSKKYEKYEVEITKNGFKVYDTDEVLQEEYILTNEML